MKYWNIYTRLINSNCTSSGNDAKDLLYWRNQLFSGTIIYLMPFSLISLLPGLYLDFKFGLYVLAMVDVLAFFMMLLIAFMPGISLQLRKVVFISSVYILSISLLYYLGLDGPGLVFLMGASIFSILILTTANVYWSAWLNSFICIFFALLLFMGVIPGGDNKVGQWIGVSSNVIFLSFLFSAMIPRLFNGLQETINKEKELTEEVGKQKKTLQEALDMLEQKNKELELFAYVASHDLKEPLRMVTSFMGLLKNKYGHQLDEKAHKYIDFSIDGGNRMQRMIDDLLELSRTARQNEDKVMVDMDDILKEVKQNICKLTEETNTEIIVRSILPVLMIYKSDIIRLLQNLVVNAIKFRKTGIDPVIQLKVIDKADEWEFCVEDNGIGIEKEHFEKIFEIFSRVHSQDTYGGTGIGLAVCKKIVDAHGGKIWVESEEGKGSGFYFTIKK